MKCLECEYFKCGNKCTWRSRLGKTIATVVNKETESPSWCPIERQKQIEEAMIEREKNRKVLVKTFVFKEESYHYVKSDFEKEIDDRVNQFIRYNEIVNVDFKTNVVVIDNSPRTIIVYSITYKA